VSRGRAALARIAGERRSRFERVGGRLRVEALANRIDMKRRALETQSKLLTSLSYQGVLARGFAIVRDEQGGMVRKAAGLAPGQTIEIEFADGRTGAQVTGGLKPGGISVPSSGPEPARSAPAAARLPRGKRGGGSSQGSLF